VPIACFAELNAQGTGLYMRGLVGSVDGRTILRADIEGQVQQAEQLGVQLAEQLLAQGAKDILAEVYGS
jgi:hydroxymethylbilane synthase